MAAFDPNSVVPDFDPVSVVPVGAEKLKTGVFGPGIAAGTDTLQSLLYSGGAALADAVKAEEARKYFQAGAERNLAEAAASGRPDLERIEDQSLSTALPYAGYQIAKQLPLMAGAIGTGMALSPFAPAIAGTAAMGALARGGAVLPRVLGGGGARAGAGFAEQKAAVQAGQQLARQTMGALPFGAAMGTGALYQSSVEGGDPSPYTAFAGAIPYGLAEVAVPSALTGMVLRGTGLSGGIAKRMLKTGTLTGTGQAGTELAQGEMEMALNPKLTPEEKESQRLNSAAAGFLGGGVPGSLGGIRGQAATVAAQEVNKLLQQNAPLKETIASAQAQAEAAVADPNTIIVPPGGFPGSQAATAQVQQDEADVLPSEEEVAAKMAAQARQEEIATAAQERVDTLPSEEEVTAKMAAQAPEENTETAVKTVIPSDVIHPLQTVGVNDVLDMWKEVLSASEGAMTSIKPQHIAAAVKGKTTITEQLAGIAALRNKKNTGTDNKVLLDQLTERLGKFKRGEKDAVQEPSAAEKISRVGETGENIPSQGAGVRQEEQGVIPAQEAIISEGNAPSAIAPETNRQEYTRLMAERQALRGKSDRIPKRDSVARAKYDVLGEALRRNIQAAKIETTLKPEPETKTKTKTAYSFALPEGAWGAQAISKIVADAKAGAPDTGMKGPKTNAQNIAREKVLSEKGKAGTLTPTEHRELVSLRTDNEDARAWEEVQNRIITGGDDTEQQAGKLRDSISLRIEIDNLLTKAKEARNRGDNIGAEEYARQADAKIKEVGQALQHHIERARATGLKAQPEHTVAQAKAMVSNIVSKWTNAPKVHVESLEDLPADIRRWLIRHKSVAVFNKKTRDIHIAADMHDNLSDVKATLFHEALGHYGLQDKFREDLNTVLQDMYNTNPDLKKMADNYLKLDPGRSNIYAMEEVLAMSQEKGGAPLGAKAKFIAWLRAWTRKFMGFIFNKSFAYTVDDARYILQQAHDIVITGPKSDYIPSATTAGDMHAARLGFKTPESAVRTTDAVLSKAADMWDNMAPRFKRQYLNWSQMTHIADMTESWIPQLKSWGVDAINPIRDKVNKLMESAAIAKEMTHAAQNVYNQMQALPKKQQDALFELMGKYQLRKVFPSMELEAHPWLKPEERRWYHEAKQLYNQPGVAKAYDAAYKYNQWLHDASMASIIKNMAQIYGAPPNYWRAINPKEGLNRDTTDVLEYAGLDANGEVLPDSYWVKLGAKKPTLDYTLQGHLASAMKLHQGKKGTPYFSLGRDGDYMVNFHVKDTPEAHAAVQQALSAAGVKESIVVNPGDTHVFSMFDTMNQALAVTKQLDKIKEHLDEKESIDDEGKPILAHYTVGLAVKKLRALDGNSPSFIRTMLAKIEEDPHLLEKEKTEQQELLRRLYINMLPESNTKFYARRAGTPGYSSDMARSFVKRAAAGAYYVAQHSTRPEQNVAMTRLREVKTELGREGSPYFDPQRQTDAVRVIDELNTRTANILMPLHTPVLDRLSAIGHTFFLSANLGFIIQNLAQPYQLSLPYLGGRHGFAATAKEMAVALPEVYKILEDTVRQGWQGTQWSGVLDATITIDRATHLSAGDREALKYLIASGRADWTQSGELTKIAEGSNRSLETALKMANSLSHYGEILNRMQTGLTAYRLEMKRSKDPAKAHAYMVQAVDDTQINYATENRSRAISKQGVFGAITPVATLFMQYSIGIVHLLTKLAMRAHGGATAQDRKEAAKSLGGILVATSLAAGTLGLPFAGILISAYNRLLGDEDEPVDGKIDYQNFLSAWLGQEAAQVVAHGPLNYITGANFAAKLGQGDVLPFTRLFSTLLDDRMLIKDRVESGALSAMGPVAGGLSNFVQGLAKMTDGHTLEGVKQMAPGALKGPIKSLDIYNNGFTTAQGVKLPMEATSWDAIVQFSGFTPTKLAVREEAQQGFDMKQRAISMRSTDLAKRFVKAVEEKDVEARLKVMEEALAFMKANPGTVVDFAGAMRRRAQEAAIAKATGSGVIGSARQVPLIREQTGFAQQP